MRSYELYVQLRRDRGNMVLSFVFRASFGKVCTLLTFLQLHSRKECKLLCFMKSCHMMSFNLTGNGTGCRTRD